MTARSIAATTLAALALFTAVPVHADHYPNVRPGVRRHDRSVVDGLSRMSYAYSYSINVGAGYCDCLEPTCEGGFMLSCGAEVIPFTGGSLTATRRSSRETCLVCGCGVTDIELRATPVCLGF